MSTYGPFLRSIGPLRNSYGQVVFYKYWSTYTQSPRTANPNPYNMTYQATLNGTLADCTNWGYPIDQTRNPTLRSQLERQAWGRLADKVNDTASLTVNVAERHQAMSMIENRALRLWQTARALRHGRLKDAARTLNLEVPPKALFSRKGSKDLGNLWLEYHFGWEPLVKDIYAAVNVLQSGFPPIRVRARAHAKTREVYNGGPTNFERTFDLKVEYGANVFVDNPNLWRANQLGLTNPAVVAWELVPFSFVVDWFLPVGSFLGQYTDFLGVTLSHPRTTYTCHSWDWEFDTLNPSSPFARREIEGHVMNRYLVINDPPLVRNRVTGISPTRAATAISLLLQQLRGK